LTDLTKKQIKEYFEKYHECPYISRCDGFKCGACDGTKEDVELCLKVDFSERVVFS